MEINKRATPAIHPPRRIPFMLEDKFKAKLCGMEKMGIPTNLSNPPSGLTKLFLISSKAKVKIR